MATRQHLLQTQHNVLQHSTTCCNTAHHVATPCNTMLQHSYTMLLAVAASSGDEDDDDIPQRLFKWMAAGADVTAIQVQPPQAPRCAGLGEQVSRGACPAMMRAARCIARGLWRSTACCMHGRGVHGAWAWGACCMYSGMLHSAWLRAWQDYSFLKRISVGEMKALQALLDDYKVTPCCMLVACCRCMLQRRATAAVHLRRPTWLGACSSHSVPFARGWSASPE
jgi:hypothetical protein